MWRANMHSLKGTNGRVLVVICATMAIIFTLFACDLGGYTGVSGNLTIYFDNLFYCHIPGEPAGFRRSQLL